MGCCCSRVIWEGVMFREQQRGIRRGFVWTWPLWIHHPLWPWKMKLRDDEHKSRYCRPERMHLQRSHSLIPLEKNVECVHNIHNRNSRRFATTKCPDTNFNQTMLWVESGGACVSNLFSVVYCCCTAVFHDPPELLTLMFPQTNAAIPIFKTLCFFPLSTHRAQF